MTRTQFKKRMASVRKRLRRQKNSYTCNLMQDEFYDYFSMGMIYYAYKRYIRHHLSWCGMFKNSNRKFKGFDVDEYINNRYYYRLLILNTFEQEVLTSDLLTKI